MPDPEETTPPTPEVETPVTPPELKEEAESVEGEEEDYDDLLFSALKKVYDEMGDDDGAVVLTPAEGADPAEPVKKKAVDEMGIDELRTALKQNNSTLKEVIKVTMQDREEQHAVDVWNKFIEGASPIEQELAKAAPFEVDDAAGMKAQIDRIKAQAAAAQRVIEEQTGVKVQAETQQLRRKYGIVTRDPGQVVTSESEQDKKDIAEGNREAVISRRFAKLRGRG